MGKSPGAQGKWILACYSRQFSWSDQSLVFRSSTQFRGVLAHLFIFCFTSVASLQSVQFTFFLFSIFLGFASFSLAFSTFYSVCWSHLSFNHRTCCSIFHTSRLQHIEPSHFYLFLFYNFLLNVHFSWLLMNFFGPFILILLFFVCSCCGMIQTEYVILIHTSPVHHPCLRCSL